MVVDDGRQSRAGRPPIGRSRAKVRRGLTKALYDMEMYFRKQGVSEYDEELDVFRFPADGRLAFCEEFADWDLLEKRGYLA